MLTLADLRPDGSINLTVEQLRRSAMELTKVGNDSQLFDEYGINMRELARIVSNYFNWSAVDHWVFDDAGWHVLAEQDRWALNDELDRRPRQLEELCLALNAQAQRWAGDEAIALLDVNVVLTDRNIDVVEDNWVRILNQVVPARLVIPLVVVHEIDRLKRTGGVACVAAL